MILPSVQQFVPSKICSILRYGKTVAQLLIRWCIQQGFVCIPKSVREERIRENGDVFDFSISDQDMQAMVSILDRKDYIPELAGLIFIVLFSSCINTHFSTT